MTMTFDSNIELARLFNFNVCGLSELLIVHRWIRHLFSKQDLACLLTYLSCRRQNFIQFWPSLRLHKWHQVLHDKIIKRRGIQHCATERRATVTVIYAWVDVSPLGLLNHAGQTGWYRICFKVSFSYSAVHCIVCFLCRLLRHPRDDIGW